MKITTIIFEYDVWREKIYDSQIEERPNGETSA